MVEQGTHPRKNWGVDQREIDSLIIAIEGSNPSSHCIGISHTSSLRTWTFGDAL